MTDYIKSIGVSLLSMTKRAIKKVESMIPIKTVEDVGDSEQLTHKKRNAIDAFFENKTTFVNKRSRIDTSEDILGETSVISCSSHKKYDISFHHIDNDLYCKCNCGEQYGRGLRTRCKHIRFVLYDILHNYTINEHKRTTLSLKTENDLISELEKMSVSIIEEKDERTIFKINFKINFKDIKMSLMYNNKHSFHLVCDSGKNKFHSIYIKKAIGSMYNYFSNSYTNVKNIEKQRIKDTEIFLSIT